MEGVCRSSNPIFHPCSVLPQPHSEWSLLAWKHWSYRESLLFEIIQSFSTGSLVNSSHFLLLFLILTVGVPKKVMWFAMFLHLSSWCMGQNEGVNIYLSSFCVLTIRSLWSTRSLWELKFVIHCIHIPFLVPYNADLICNVLSKSPINFLKRIRSG